MKHVEVATRNSAPYQYPSHRHVVSCVLMCGRNGNQQSAILRLNNSDAVVSYCLCNHQLKVCDGGVTAYLFVDVADPFGSYSWVVLPTFLYFLNDVEKRFYLQKSITLSSCCPEVSALSLTEQCLRLQSYPPYPTSQTHPYRHVGLSQRSTSKV